MQITMMLLPTIYISLLLVAVILYFMNSGWALKYKKALLALHFVLLLLVILDLSVFNLRGFWLDRLLVIVFMLTGSAIFALYRNTLQLWKKIYFGLFLFYPLLAPLTFFIDRIAFILALSPFIATLMVPETRYSSQDYDIRSPIGLMSGRRLQLIQKGTITESLLGTCNSQDVVSLDISSLEVSSQTTDSIKAIIISKGKKYPTIFYRQL
jgi:hypothetical protein